MSEKIAINRITNGNVYIDGNCLLGKVEEIKLPDIEVKMADHKAVGMVGEIELPSGIQKMSGEIKWNSYYPKEFAKLANPFEFVQLQVRSSMDTYSALGRTAQQPLVTFLTVAFKKNPLGTFKQNDNVELPSGFACYYVRQTLGGQDVLEFDPMSNIYKVNGVDLLARYRANVGG